MAKADFVAFNEEREQKRCECFIKTEAKLNFVCCVLTSRHSGALKRSLKPSGGGGAERETSVNE
jgi:hypothetical protein